MKQATAGTTKPRRAERRFPDNKGTVQLMGSGATLAAPPLVILIFRLWSRISIATTRRE
jgi:hypothetical protein